MNKRKTILVIILLLLTTGCTFRYEIDITDDEVTEQRTMLINNSEIENNDIKGTIRKKISKYSINDDMMIAPSSKTIKEDTMSGYQTTIKYKLNEYKNSDILNMCYKSYNIISEENKIYLSTGREFNCFTTLDELDSVKIILTTNHKVIKHNADQVDNERYIWNITKDQASNKPINIELVKNSEEETKDNTETKKKFKIVFISIVAFFSIIVIIMLVIKRKRVQKMK